MCDQQNEAVEAPSAPPLALIDLELNLERRLARIDLRGLDLARSGRRRWCATSARSWS
jgi:hypothetical protein